MEINLLERRIRQKAEKRFNDLFQKTKEILRDNPILNQLKIGELSLISENGYCPKQDLFYDETELLIKKTNFIKIKEEIIKEYEKEETDTILNKINILTNYLKQGD